MCASDPRRLAALFLVAAVLAAVLTPAGAADNKKDAAIKEQVRRMQQAQRKLEQEKTQLGQEKAAAEDKLKQVEGKLGDARQRAAGAAQRVATLGKELEVMTGEKEALAARLADTEKRLAQTTGQFTDAERERKRLEALVADRKQALAECEEKNGKLFLQGRHLLESYQRKSCADAALQREPLLGLKRIEIENFVEDQTEALAAQRIEKAAGH
jgi:chromosome segregation ATPase